MNRGIPLTRGLRYRKALHNPEENEWKAPWMTNPGTVCSGWATWVTSGFEVRANSTQNWMESFTPQRLLQVVVATNIAESSLTVPGVKTVIDFAMHRQNVYDDEARGLAMLQLLISRPHGALSSRFVTVIASCCDHMSRSSAP